MTTEQITFTLEIFSDLSGVADINIFSQRPDSEKEMFHTFKVWRIDNKWILRDNSGLREVFKTRKAAVEYVKDMLNIA